MKRRHESLALPTGDVPSRLAVTLCLAGFVASLLLNMHHVAWWSVVLAIAAAAWRARAAWRTHQLPGPGLRFALVVVLTVAVLGSFRTLNGLEAGATLLIAMGAAKLLETRKARDWYIVIGTAMFLLLAACLDRQQLWRMPLYAADLWLLATALRAVGLGSSSVSLRPLARASGRGLLLATPLMLVLFLFFPRLPGAFWALPQDETAITGLGEEMSPGSISQLSESDEQAMRVRFDGPLPPPAERYWRGPVLHDFDGYTWRRHMGVYSRPPPLEFTGTAYRYEVTLEPNSHNVLVALEMPVQPDIPFTNSTGDFQLLSFRPVSQARSYTLTSRPAWRTSGDLSTYARRIELDLPRQRNLRSLALGQQMRSTAGTDEAFVTAVVEYFRSGGFVYTLTPPRLSLNSVDDFLFGTREGFCGHYASAFVTLMRAGGVPARVVTGYLGGEWNSIGGYLVLRQSHAHAWAEVWLQGRGWTRIDPTAVVAPERLTRDIFDLIGNASRAPARLLRETPWIGSAIQAFEALNAWWQDGVIGFNFRKQLDLIESLGFEDRDWHILAGLLGAGGVAWLLFIAWSLRDQLKPQRADPLARVWRLLEQRLATAGLPRATYEGPLAYAERVGTLRPDIAAALLAIARRYAELRFGDTGADIPDELHHLRTAIRALPLGSR